METPWHYEKICPYNDAGSQMLGGSLPLSVFEDVLRTPILTLPLVNYDNNQHAANEHLRLGNLWEGIEILAAIMTGL